MPHSLLTGLSITLTLLAGQQQYPPADHAWLRFKTGTWIKHKVTIKVNGSTSDSFQKLTFKDKSDKDYSIEELSTDGQDKAPIVKRTTLGTIIGKDTLTFDTKEYLCEISTSTTQGPEGALEMKYWMPKGNKYPLRVEFKQPGFEGVVNAVAIEEKVKVGDRQYSCARLQGKVKAGGRDGTLTAWLSQEIPGAQAKLEMKLDSPDGVFEMYVETVEIHEEK